MQDSEFESFLESQLPKLLETMFSVLKENIESVFSSTDGLYCMLFIKNCLVKEMCKELIWQQMHVLMSKLTQTQRKVNTLRQRQSATELNESFSSDNRQVDDSDNISELEVASKSESSNKESGSSVMEKQVSQHTDGSKVYVSFSSKPYSNSEKRVFSALCRHLALDIYFDVNATQVKDMAGIPEDSVFENL